MRGHILAIAAFMLSSGAQAWDDCKYEAASHDKLKIGKAKLVEIDARAGFLRIEGQAGMKEITVDATACATEEKLLDAVEWSLERDTDRIRLRVDLPQPDDNQYALLNLIVTVPEGIDMDISDTSGSLTVSSVGALRVQDSSGSIDIRDAGGSVLINDSSGSITVADVNGNMEIEDGSGSIDVEHVSGSVRVSDGSGSIDIDNVKGTVEIEEDGSGSISVADVGGDFIVRDDGSGGISHERIAGEIRLPD